MGLERPGGKKAKFLHFTHLLADLRHLLQQHQTVFFVLIDDLGGVPLTQGICNKFEAEEQLNRAIHVAGIAQILEPAAGSLQALLLLIQLVIVTIERMLT